MHVEVCMHVRYAADRAAIIHARSDPTEAIHRSDPTDVLP